MEAQETMVNQEQGNVDLSKVAALQQKRTVAFVNHFVTTTVQFLNSFMKRCEQKLMHFERKLEKVEAAMVLLEARLSSIPEINIPQPETKQDPTLETKPVDEPDQTQESTTKEPKDTGPSEVPKEDDSVQAHPEYNKFVKMVHVGVPLPAVRLKLSLEGLDPNVLDKILGK